MESPTSAEFGRSTALTGTSKGTWESKECLRRRALFFDPPTGKLPYQPWARAKRKTMNPVNDPQAKFLAGVPGIDYTPGPFQIFQSVGVVAIVYQDLHTFRYIP